MRILPKVTGVLALFFAFVCVNTWLYDKSPWGGGGFVNLDPVIIAVAFHVSLIFFVVTAVLLYCRRKRAGVTGFDNWKTLMKRALPLFTGTAAVFGLQRFIFFAQSETYYYLTGFYVSMFPSRFLGLTIKQHFIVHCAVTALFIMLTVIFVIVHLISEKNIKNHS